ncbi:hypothetical protein DV515_00004556, partial [Chloebia gouldiae]
MGQAFPQVDAAVVLCSLLQLKCMGQPQKGSRKYIGPRFLILFSAESALRTGMCRPWDSCQHFRNSSMNMTISDLFPAAVVMGQELTAEHGV